MKTRSKSGTKKTLRAFLLDLREQAEVGVRECLKNPTLRGEIEAWLEQNGLNSPKKFLSLAGQTAIYAFLKLLLLHLSGRSKKTTLPQELPHCVLDDISEHIQVDRETALTVIRETIVRARSAETDLFGPIYNEFVNQKERRKLGQFWTPPHVAEFMAAWTIDKKQDSFLDPGHGPGIFMLQALRRFEELGVSPKRAVAQIAGYEVNPVAYLMGMANLALRAAGNTPHLTLDDFLLFDGGRRAYDAIVCNPPYTRHHLLPARYKEELPGIFKREFGFSVSRISSLFLYFFFQATRLLNSDGRMAFITPAEVFESFYSQSIKQLILGRLGLRALIIFHENHTVFEGVDTAACITLIEGSSSKAAPVRLVEVEHWPGTPALLRALDQKPRAYPWGKVEIIPPSQLRPQSKWTTKKAENRILTDPRLIPLKWVASVVRGIATGANSYFVLTDEERTQWELEDRYLSPVITKTREVLNYRLTSKELERIGREGKKRWLISLTDPLTSTARKYIEHGKELSVQFGALVSTRRNWYETEKREIPPIIFTYLSRSEPRFILNEANAHALNVFLLVYPIPEIARDETTLKAFVTLLNSHQSREALKTVGRSYGGDTLKLEPRELDILPVIDPRRLSDSEKRRLAELLDALCEARMNGRAEEVHESISAEVKRLLDELPAHPQSSVGEVREAAQLPLQLGVR